jgi:cytochrome c oxidase subunit 3
MLREAHVAEHFADAEVQRHAQRLGIWLFLATEVLLFAGLFVSYSAYRSLYGAAFALSSRHLSAVLGMVNTVVLITSSFTVAMAHHYAKLGQNRMVFLCLAASILMGLTFLVIHGFEYVEHFHEGALPGKYYTFEKVQLPGASMFFTLYFFLTGLHSLHVLAGVGVLSWVARRAMVGSFTPSNYAAVELGGLYWHLVDLIWIFLFPLLYLI